MDIIPITSTAKDEIAAWKKKAKPIIFTKVPFTALLYGSSGTGKSTMVANVLIRNFDGLLDLYNPSRIHIYAKNGLSDVNFRALMTVLRTKDPEWNNFNASLDIKEIRDLIDKNREMFDQDPRKRLMRNYQHLLIIDDQIMDRLVSSRSTSGEIVELAVQGRHQCISTMCLVQNITSINHVVRRNASHVFAFRMNAQSERQKLFDDIAHGSLTRQVVNQIYDFAISDSLTKDGQGIGFLTYRPYIQDLNQAFFSSLKRSIVFKEKSEDIQRVSEQLSTDQT